MAWPADQVDSCAFLPCDQVTTCAMVGGCVNKRFPRQRQATNEALKPAAQALNGTKPGRTNRDPSKIQRKRKPL